MVRYKRLPPVERLRQVLDYDAATGRLTWRVNRGGSVRAGAVAGTRRGGYIVVKLDGVEYRAHRLIHKWMTGSDPLHELDHIDLDGENNRWSNLRACTRSQNMCNRPALGSIGLKGVHQVGDKFRAEIACDGVRTSLGTFPTAELAHSAWWEASRRFHGPFARRK